MRKAYCVKPYEKNCVSKCTFTKSKYKRYNPETGQKEHLKIFKPAKIMTGKTCEQEFNFCYYQQGYDAAIKKLDKDWKKSCYK